MTTSTLPVELSQAIESEVARFRIQDLRRSTAALSERYRGRSRGRGSFIESDIDATAYAAYRMPATYAAIWSVFGRIIARFPNWSPETVLDVGGGTGAGIWAVRQFWRNIRSFSLVDQDEWMIQLGKRLIQDALEDLPSAIHWDTDRFDPSLHLESASLVLASYTLNELADSHLDACVERLWSATNDFLVVIEPGTPAGFERIRRIRRNLLSVGARVVAPCPHSQRCPMPDTDWCHFSVRLPRSRIHLEIKPGDLGYEDEKFSYVVFARSDVTPAEARIIRHPQIRKGMVRLELCTPDGLRSETVTRRKDRERYRLGRSSSWGDEFPIS